ncbi:MAG: hypothetical protein WBE92_02645 [Steroidobacteraceae bacterium]
MIIDRNVMARQRAYHEAMQRFLAQKPFSFHFVRGRRPTREDLHDRCGQRHVSS